MITTVSHFIKRKLGWLGSPRIVPYIGYGDQHNVYISGEITEDYGISKPTAGQSRWKNIKAMAKRYISRDLKGVKVTVTYMGKSKESITDDHGIFRCHFQHVESDNTGEIWRKATICCLRSDDHPNNPDTVDAEVMIITGKPQFGVISDIDDTILVSYATQKLTKLRLMLLNNAHTRMPFEGVSAFYHALQRGTNNNGFNPVFYVSNSEWNLFDLLYEFIQFNRIPKGPLFLREMKINLLRLSKLREVNKNHKSEALHQLFSDFPKMQFILIGDSGQHDPEIYSQIVKKFPGRVLAIYIRDIGIEENMASIKTISEHINSNFKVEMVVVKDTEAAAKHAMSKGFISADYLQPIIEEKQKDLEKKDQAPETVL
jgi:phosphatidate phosphatase APP1